MLGVIFVSFADFVQEEFGLDTVDHILDTELASGGAYTAVGTYDFTEMVLLAQRLAAHTGAPLPELLVRFGRDLFHRLARAYPEFVTRHPTPFALLEEVEDHIHVEVRKLYPDAELPSLSHEVQEDNEMFLLYNSPRNLPDLCEGLVRGCFEHFAVPVSIEREPVPGPAQAVRFHIRQPSQDD